MTTLGDNVKLKERMLEMYWKCEGTKTGQMKGSVDIKGFEDTMRVYGISWGVATNVDQQSGQATGKRLHEPLIITKPVDKATPLLLNAMCSHENIKKTEFIYLDVPGGATAAAKMVKVFSIITEDGYIGKIEAGSTSEGVLLEKIHLYFTKITWRHEVSKAEAYDDRHDTI